MKASQGAKGTPRGVPSTGNSHPAKTLVIASI